jgi:hypothetical protein
MAVVIRVADGACPFFGRRHRGTVEKGDRRRVGSVFPQLCHVGVAHVIDEEDHDVGALWLLFE